MKNCKAVLQPCCPQPTFVLLTYHRTQHPRPDTSEARRPVHREQSCAKSPPPLPYRLFKLWTNIDQEFSTLDDDAKIYKLVGPVLLKQDTVEAKGTVDSRLEYIGTEM